MDLDWGCSLLPAIVNIMPQLVGVAGMSSLFATLTSDILAGCASGLVCAPLVAVFDEAITLNSAGKKKLVSAARVEWIPAFRLPARLPAAASGLVTDAGCSHRSRLSGRRSARC